MARPGGLELPTFWFAAVRPTLLNLARGVANRTESASWGKFPQPAFSFLYCYLRHFCRSFLQLALHSRDSIAITRDFTDNRSAFRGSDRFTAAVSIRQRSRVGHLRYIREMSLKIVASTSRTLWAESTGNTLGFNFLSALPTPSSNRSIFLPADRPGEKRSLLHDSRRLKEIAPQVEDSKIAPRGRSDFDQRSRPEIHGPADDDENSHGSAASGFV
jgi:hypothetical protein